MKLITAFFMAWGNFITLPCPYKKWDDKLKNLMLAMLPSVGMVVGALFLLLSWGMQKLNVPPLIMAFAIEFYMFYIHGFMHLDGFMDTTDAVMSRRPLEDRQRILKDSNVGAFAVVMTIFVLLGWFAAFYTAITIDPKVIYAMVLIPVASRGLAGIDVLSYKPIGHSQYVDDYKEPGRGKYKLACYAQMILFLILYIAAMVFSFGSGNYSFPVMILPVIFTELGVWLSSAYARSQLGGMSGDIAGYSIIWGEFAGVAGAALLVNYLTI